MSAGLYVGDLTGSGVPAAGSMARAIYDALAAQIPLRPDEDPHGRSRLAVAVASGVISHLQANAAALHVTVNEGHGPVRRDVTVDTRSA
jgi:hypothetical protein